MRISKKKKCQNRTIIKAEKAIELKAVGMKNLKNQINKI